MVRLNTARLNALVEEATVDCYDDDEQVTGLFAMIADNLSMPFSTRILGVDVTVTDIELRGRYDIVGLNFPLIEEVIGPDGRIVGVDLTDAMLARAQDRIAANAWSNISLVQADAVDFDFPTEVNAILSTYALTQVPECAEVIAHGAAALSRGGRWVVLDVKFPDYTPGWLAQLGTAIVRHFASVDEWIMRRPWETIRGAMQEELTDVSWTELFFGTAFLVAGCRDNATFGVRPPGSGHQ